MIHRSSANDVPMLSGAARERERRLACLFDLLLTRYAVSRPRHGFQSFGIDLTSTGEAEAKAAVVDPPERLLHHLKQMPLVCALAEQKVLRVRACRTVDHVGGQGIVNRASGLLFLDDAPTQFLPASFEPFSKLLQLLPVHTRSRELRL